jgi:ATP/maltotriose-dependent transcriptional regulator MalT
VLQPGLLLHAAGVELDASELSKLSERTAGWAAGLYLAALSLHGAPSPNAVGFAGDDRFVNDYFRAERSVPAPNATRARAERPDAPGLTALSSRPGPR